MNTGEIGAVVSTASLQIHLASRGPACRRPDRLLGRAAPRAASPVVGRSWRAGRTAWPRGRQAMAAAPGRVTPRSRRSWPGLPGIGCHRSPACWPPRCAPGRALDRARSWPQLVVAVTAGPPVGHVQPAAGPLGRPWSPGAPAPGGVERG